MNLSQQYDKIYRYCFFHTRCQELAEDLTQETFLRYYQHPQYQSTGKELQYLYVIARNLCIDTYRKPSAEPLSEENMPVVSVQDDDFITHVALRNALSELTAEERELILLRYVNEVPVVVMSQLYGISRFALHRKLKAILAKLRKHFGKEADGY